MEFIDLKTQYQRYKAEIDERIHRVLDHAHFILGPEILELETALASYVGVRHCLTVASGTDSLEIALRALDIGPGDEVITVPFTWISTAEAVALVGAKPVFVDIEPVAFNIDIDLMEKAITPKTKAILPVSLFGQMPDYDRINAIASAHGLPVIEDAAQSFGASQRGRRSGGVTTIGSTSFFPAKPLGCYGDGGALFTDDDPLADKMRAIRTHGGVKRHHHPLVGMNGRFDTIQAAVLLAKLGCGFGEMIRLMFVGKKSFAGVSSFQALAMSLSGRVGTGNIAGVATAISIGGPGAVFWMWLVAFLGASTAYVESTLGQIYKEKDDKGQYRGGPAFYIEKAMGQKWYAMIFAVVTVVATGFLLPGVQANSIAASFNNAWGVSTIVTGGCIVIALGLIIFGGVKRIALFAEIVVPFMALAYIIMALVIMAVNYEQVPGVFALILKSAFGLDAGLAP